MSIYWKVYVYDVVPEEGRMPITRDSNHELSLLVSSSTWHGLTIIGQQRTCTLSTLHVILRLDNPKDLENHL